MIRYQPTYPQECFRLFKLSRMCNLFYREIVKRNSTAYHFVPVAHTTGYVFQGFQAQHGSCGVSIVRSGEAMERGLRDCCRSLRIGKILIQVSDDGDARVYYAKLPPNIANCKVLLMYPVMSKWWPSSSS